VTLPISPADSAWVFRVHQLDSSQVTGKPEGALREGTECTWAAAGHRVCGSKAELAHSTD